MQPGANQHIFTGLPQLFERAPGLVVVLSGPEHVVEYANPAYLRLRGRQQVIGLPLRESAPELVAQGFLAFLDKVLATGEPFVGHDRPIHIRHADGTVEERYFDFIYQPVLGEDGRPIGIFGQGTEVTDRVRAERALRASETRLELATRAANLGIWDWRLDVGEIVVDARVRELLGFPEGVPITPAMLTEGLHPEDVAATQAHFRRAMDPKVKDSTAYEHRLVRPDGSVVWVRAHGCAIFEERDGEEVAVRYVGTIADVTEERRAQDALRRSEGRLRLAIDAGRMAVWSVDPAGEMQVTPELNRLLGLPEDASPSLAELRASYYPGELERFTTIVREARARGERFIELEYRHLWPDKSVHWLLARAELLADADGRPQGSIGVLMDITDRHETEERLRLLAREVDHRANNLLAVVQGAISLTPAGSVAEFKEALLGRIAALAHAHKLLANSRWRSADLGALVREELLPYCEGTLRCSIHGPRLALPPSLAQGVSMAVHELATNALKYGALSAPDGHVEVSWTNGGPGQPSVVTWRETGGPPVSKPKRKGFGTRVIERALAGPLGGHVVIDWRPEGLVCRLFLGDGAGEPPLNDGG
jgi:PAS domain S-box-containing protein